jgi:fructose-bisphosphate aldolase class 1
MGIIPASKFIPGQDLATHPREKATEGLDDLRVRLKESFEMGTRFAEWRSVIA